METTYSQDIWPNLIADKLVLVKPMEGLNTVLIYREYFLGTPKGSAGGEANDAPFGAAIKSYGGALNANTIINGWGTNDFVKMDEARQNYTGEKVVETVVAGSALENQTTFTAAWTPLKKGVFKDAAGVAQDVRVVKADGTVEFGTADVATGEITLTSALAAGDRVAYAYDNAYIPAEQLPTVGMRMAKKTVDAKIRRIEIMYSKLAAYSAKKEYGFDLKSELVQQATAEIEYEQDCEIIDMLTAIGDRNVAPHVMENGRQFAGYGVLNAATGKYEPVTWVDEELDTLAYSLKAEGFMRKIGQLKAKIYKQTARFMPNWMIVSPEMLPILAFVPSYKAASTTNVNGAYQAGTLDGMQVFVTPRLEGKVCYMGVLGKEMDCAAAAYMPYMAITPSSLLDFPDDTTVQGFCSVYGLAELNTQLVGKLQVIEGDDMARVLTREF